MAGKIDWSDVFRIKVIHVDSLYGRVERHGFKHHDRGGYYVDEVVVDYDPFPKDTTLEGNCVIRYSLTDINVRIWFERNDEDGLIATDWEVM